MAKKPASVTKARGAGASRGPRIAAVITVVIVAVAVFGGIPVRQVRDGRAGRADPAHARRRDLSDVGAERGHRRRADRGGPAHPRRVRGRPVPGLPAVRDPRRASRSRRRGRRAPAGPLPPREPARGPLRPAGYSTTAGNAIICAAENGAFPSVHASLYAAQPEENAAGYTTDQLVALGQQVGAGQGTRPASRTARTAPPWRRTSSRPRPTRRSRRPRAPSGPRRSSSTGACNLPGNQLASVLAG